MRIMPHELKRPSEVHTIADVARQHGIKPDTLRNRLRKHPDWTIGKALNQPFKPNQYQLKRYDNG